MRYVFILLIICCFGCGCGISYKSELAVLQADARGLGYHLYIYKYEHGFFPDRTIDAFSSIDEGIYKELALCESSDGRSDEWLYYGMYINEIIQKEGTDIELYLIASPFPLKGRDGEFYRVVVYSNGLTSSLISEECFSIYERLIKNEPTRQP